MNQPTTTSRDDNKWAIQEIMPDNRYAQTEYTWDRIDVRRKV